jgi:hypothetical protein
MATHAIRLSLLAAMLCSRVALGASEVGPAAAAQLEAAPLGQKVERPLPLLGLMVDGGVPDGATVSAVYRPFSWLRTEVGAGYNLISKGARAGLTLLPFGAGPSATVEAGHFFDGDANGFARSIAGAGFEDKAILQRIGYDFANAHLGLDFGTRRVVFFIHGGMSYVRAQIHNVNEQVASATSSSSATTVSFNQDPTVRVVAPSAKLGFIFYIW